MTVSATPVVLVGSACRLPRVDGLAAFWDVLTAGRCVITEVDEERFGAAQHKHADRTAPGRAVTFAAGQLDKPFHFDPGYFGISPREAAVMDPQQRVLLEVAVEALENAGIPAAALAGEAVGVYVGASSLDYGTSAQLDPAAVEPQSMTGNTLSIIANRMSYIFDLRGPSYVVDTACSSSLIALHNAIRDIQTGVVETAIVGGVSLLFHPIPFIGFSRAQMLSASGLCRAFDAGADGYVRSEGAVALVLRAEGAARASADPIRARFVASGINADGRTAGLSLPSMTAQADLLRSVYDRAGLDPNRLAFVEAHGTGTPVGDPIEARAIGEVLAQRRDTPLPVGSSKTNFGHLEPASGLVGILKSQLALEHDYLPASLHYETPNPHISFAELNLDVTATGRTLERGAPRIAGINSFGFGGANAHVVIADGEAVASDVPCRAAPLVVSAASAEALKALVRRHAERLGAGADAAAIANAAAHRRERLAHRAVVAPDAPAAMAEALNAVAHGEDHPLASVGEAVVAPQKPVFVYSGNGSQWAGMGRAAYQGETDFRLSFDRTDRAFMSVAGWSLVTMLFSEDLETEIERTEIAQPLLFALQVALTEALRRKGMTPAAVIGHSVGEVAAAWACGALSLADAVRVIHARSTHQEVTRHLGGMAALLLPAAEAEAAIAPFAGLELAAINSNRSVTISGPVERLSEFAKECRKRRWAMKRLPLDYPFHCALVEPIRDPLLAALSGIAARPASLPFISTVDGAAIEGDRLGAEYWWRNVRRPVLFAAAVQHALEGHRLFVEIGPRPVLTTYLTDAARAADQRVTVLPSFVQNDTRPDQVGAVVRSAVAHGVAVEDDVVFGPRSAAPDILPAYPWQHSFHQVARTSEEVRVLRRLDHPLLGQRLRVDDRDWRGFPDTGRLPFLADHRVEDAVVFPAAGFVEMLLAAGRMLHGDGPIEVRDLDIVAPLVLDGETQREVRTAEIAPNTFLISSRPRLSPDGWTPHVKATVGKAPALPKGTPPAGEPEGRTVSATELYERTRAFGLNYGPMFRRAGRVTLIGAERAHVRLSAADPATQRQSFALDPTLFDSCFHALFAFIAERRDGGGVAVLPVRLGRLTLAPDAAPPAEATLAVRLPAEGIAEADFTLFDANGRVVAAAEAVRFQVVPLSAGADDIIVAEPMLKRLSRMRDPATVVPDIPGALTCDGVEPSETALLVEAGVQAAAATVLRPLLETPARLAALCESGALHVAALPLVSRLLLALEASGVAVEHDETWHIPEVGMNVDDVVALLIAEYPERLAEAAVIAALPERLEQAFASGLQPGNAVSDALFAQLLSDAPISAPIYDALAATVRAALAEAPDASVRICLIGAGNVAFLRTVIAGLDPARTALTVADWNDAASERAALLIGPSPGVTFAPLAEAGDDQHAFDVVILAPQLAAASLADVTGLLKPDGTLIGAAYAPSLFTDALGGLTADWWSGSVDAQTPVGRLADAAEWESALTGAGLTPLTVKPLASPDTDALIFAARNAVEAPPLAALEMPSIHARGGMARKVCDALSAMAPQAAAPAGLEARPEGACLVAVSVDGADELADHLAALGAFLVRLGPEPRRVTIVTFGAHGSGGKDTVPAGAAVAAFARTALNEMPQLDIRLVDIAPSFDASEAAVRLHKELEQPNAEREIVLSSDYRAALRYVAAPPERHGEGDTAVLAVPRRGSIDNLVWSAAAGAALGPDDVRLRVEATGLNFRDVMWTLGLLPHEALQDGYAGPTLGMECAGTVEAVGDDVTGLAVGDPVIAFAPAAFASHVVVRADAVARRPAEIEPAAAATIPVAFLTAFYAFIELGRLEEDETVLIHGGAGGVGLAALQIARWRGARVFATAGTVEKRALLARLGADAVFDSRSLTFADEVLEATGGKGVDVVLNSLAGEAMERSLTTLKPFGRFLELGKRDFYADTKLGLRPFRQNLSYFGIDADQLMRHRPRLAQRLLGEVMGLFEQGELTPLPYRRFEAEGVRDAFRLMQHAGHIGKIVVAAPPPPAPTSQRPTRIDADKTYLLVGGTSGFGFATAEWLIDEGARHLVLASRSGVTDEVVAEALARHRDAGVSVAVATLDVADPAAVRALVEGIDAAHPLTGVFHMAMVLDDALIENLDAERHARVLTPKVKGVEALLAATEDVDLSLFVVYSSITTQLGNPGQANYVAANAYLEAVAMRRRAAGRPALAVAWGAIGDVGVLARDMKTSEILQQKLGRHTITAAQGLGELKALLAAGAMHEGAAVRLVGKVDWGAARKDLQIASSPAFMDLAEDGGRAAEDSGVIDLSAHLKGMSETEAVAEVTRMLAAEISRILKLPASEVDVRKPLTALGMDSLMGVELRMAAEQRLGIDVPLMSLASGATLTDLARKVVLRTLSEEDAELSGAAAIAASRHLEGEVAPTGELDDLAAAVEERSAAMRTFMK